MALIDGIKCSFSFTEHEYNAWRLQTSKLIRTWISIYEDTGEVKTEEDEGNGKWRVDRNKKYKWFTIIHSAKFQTYDILIKEKNYELLISGNKSKSFRGEISGSLTSNYHGGENWKDLTFDQLQQELDRIEREVCLDLQKVKIDNIEPSINFRLNFSVLSFIDKNLIAYKNKPFNRYGKNRKGKALGRFTELTDKTTVKIYDKSEEYNLPENLMQFELHFKKMAVLKEYGIAHLSDLRDWHKVNSLLSLLVSYFDRVLIYDPSIDKNDLRLTDIQREMISRGRAFEYWEDLKSDSSNGTYYNRLEEFKTLSSLYGADYHNKIRNAFLDKWIELMGDSKSCKNFPSVKSELDNPKLEKLPGTVGENILQLNIKDRIEPILKNMKTGSVKVTSLSSKSKKQMLVERREKSEKQFKSFLNALGVTLQKLEREAA
jgi:hypothetical protein